VRLLLGHIKRSRNPPFLNQEIFMHDSVMGFELQLDLREAQTGSDSSIQ
jgi:hypothetical protein